MDDSGSYVAAACSALAFHFRRFWLHWCVFIFTLLVWAWVGFFVLTARASAFASGSVVVISRGETTREVADALTRAHVIAYPQVLYAVIRLWGNDRGIQAGAYRFDRPENVLEVADRLRRGDTRTVEKRITFPEGQTVREMSERISSTFSSLSTTDFISIAKPYEGYLFPDTYSFKEDASASLILDTMRANFNTQIASITPEISTSGHTLNDIVTMASLIEKEARTMENRRIIAGILWHRIALQMPLQVDAVFGYINNRSTYSPTLAELSLDSPYNTYTRQGLPPGPIGNPGLDTMDAVLNPIKTDYLFYITDKDGVIHFAKTFAEHKKNIATYLN